MLDTIRRKGMEVGIPASFFNLVSSGPFPEDNKVELQAEYSYL